MSIAGSAQAPLADVVTLAARPSRSAEMAKQWGLDVADAPRWFAALPHVQTLSERETDVFDLLAAGRSNREISRRLRIAERTVKKHIGSIMEKLGLDSRLQVGLAALAYRMTSAA